MFEFMSFLISGSRARFLLIPAIFIPLTIGGLCCKTDNTSSTIPTAPVDDYENLQLVREWFLSPLPPEYEPGTPTDSIPSVGGLADSLSGRGFDITAIEDCEYRLRPDNWQRNMDASKSGYIRNLDLFRITAAPCTLLTYHGRDIDSLAIEIVESKQWLEELTGKDCPTLAYPYHEHDFRTLALLRDSSYICARSGQISYYPWSAHLLGTNPDAWLETWAHTSLYEVPLQMMCGDVMDIAPEEVADWLAAPSRLPTWKLNNTWIQLYTHSDDPTQTGTPTLDREHLAAVVDALTADSEVWIAPIGEIAAWVRQTHVPEDADGFIWRPTTGTSVLGREEGPWQGHQCAFSFSTDDGFKANLSSFSPVFVDRGLSYTMYLNPVRITYSDSNPESNYLNSLEVTQLADAGIEIGSHTMNHKHLLQPEIFQISSDHGPDFPYWFEIVRENNQAIARLYREINE
ncbi:MAG: polysaccharide deacetylase family protein [bacterium]|nr:polysaccharide deacetylase family protein [bacterium]